MMNKLLRVLNVEDSERDAKLLTRHLSKAGYDLTLERVETSAEMKTALQEKEWDIILCDYVMPNFGALAAIDVLKENGLDIPLIIISGTIGEEKAVEAMLAGANDYLMKDNLARLVPAIERELQDVKNRNYQRQSEIALRKSQERYRHLLDTANEGVLITNADLKITYVNQQLLQMLGLTREEVLGESVLILLEDTSEVEQRLQQRIKGVKEQFDFQLRRKDGSLLWVIVNSSPIQDEDGNFAGVLSMMTDISQRKNAEEKLVQSEARYRLLFDNNPHPMWVFDKETLGFLEVNDAAIHHYGYSREEFLSKTIKEIRPVEDVPILMQFLSSNELKFKFTGSWRHQKKDGTIIEVEVTTHDFTFNKRPARLVLAQDVTEKRNLEQQLRQSQKMEAIGRLAGGISHDFNNMLTAIKGYSDLALRQLTSKDPLRYNIEEIIKASDRSTDLTRQLLAFSRKQILEPKIIDLNLIIMELEKMLERLIGEDIKLSTVLEESIGSVRADPGQIEQVIMNLVVNARDAMPDGGNLIVETKNVYLDEDYASCHIAVVPGNYVMLAVSDTGIGMDAETQSHIFEPFFTTKEMGKGTGLGLSTVYGIVKQSEGNLWVYSELGHGTSFKIYFPHVEDATQEKSSVSKKDKESNHQGTETILLVEDEELVRNLAKRILETFGYQVLAAPDGKVALSICEFYENDIHLLITDAVMPEMSGRELTIRISKMRPEMKILYMSGYTDKAAVEHGILEEGYNFIQKPFMPTDLAAKVRKILDE